MRAWPTRLSGFKLTLPAGWYTLPWYMPSGEVRRLLDLLRMGLEADYAVELEWPGLNDVAGRARIDKCVVVLRVPGDVDSQSIASAQAKLGDVRFGLVLHERPGDWAAVDWQQRHIKVPLLSALKRELHMGSHPFADLGLTELPLADLAKLTAEPVELLELLDSTIAHRLQHAAQGLEREDWQRSIARAVADRLAMRLSNIPPSNQAAALDFALDAREQPLWPALARREASEVLTHVGLAWREGSDVLIGALARQASTPLVLRRLLTQLSESAWSRESRAFLAEVMPKQLPLPRAAQIVPEPRYADWPVVGEAEVMAEVFHRIGQSSDANQGSDFFKFRTEFHYMVEEYRRPTGAHLWYTWRENPWGRAINAIHAAFMELRDDALIALDFERNQLRRFDAVDQALGELPGHVEIGALVRWIGITELARRTFDHSYLAILEREIEGSVELVEEDTRLHNALLATLGDLLASRQHHVQALSWWTKAGAGLPDSFGLILRRMLVLLRLNRFDRTWWELYNAGESFDGPRDLNAEYENDIGQVIQLLSEQEPRSRTLLSGPRLTHPNTNGSATLMICLAAVALERRDWPLAIHVLDPLGDATPPEAARARLLWAWTRAALGDIDLAGATFEELEQLATSWSDERLANFAAQGRAWVASQGSAS